MILSKEAILKADDLPKKTVTVEEWGGDVIVRSMTGVERDAWEIEQYGSGKVNMKNMRARLVAVTAIDEKGKRLFTQEEAEELGKKSAKAIAKVYDAASKLNGLGADDIEELAGESKPDQDESSTST